MPPKNQFVNIRVDAEINAAIEALRADGYNVSALVRKALTEKAAELKTNSKKEQPK